MFKLASLAGALSLAFASPAFAGATREGGAFAVRLAFGLGTLGVVCLVLLLIVYALRGPIWRVSAGVGALAFACALAACNAPAPTAAVPTPAATSIASKVQSLAQVAGGDLTKACSTFNIAVGYYQDVAFLIPAPASTIASGVIVAGNLLCALPSGNVSTDLAQLGALWTQIQALTTVPK